MEQSFGLRKCVKTSIIIVTPTSSQIEVPKSPEISRTNPTTNGPIAAIR